MEFSTGEGRSVSSEREGELSGYPLGIYRQAPLYPLNNPATWQPKIPVTKKQLPPVRNAFMSVNRASLWGKHTGVNSENPEIPPPTTLRRCLAVIRYDVEPLNVFSFTLIFRNVSCNRRRRESVG